MKSLKNDSGTVMNQPSVYLQQVREFSVKEKGMYTKQLVVVVGNT